MIAISSPSAVVNDIRCPVRLTMDRTISVGAANTILQIARDIAGLATTVQRGRIDNLILNSHGGPGYCQLGTGLTVNTMAAFAGIRGKVVRIWFHGCLVARTIDSNTPRQADGAVLQASNYTSGDGHRFISRLAILTGCYIIAPTQIQVSHLRSYPNGLMDSYEGLVLEYNPQGVISRRFQNRVLYDYDVKAGTARSRNGE